MVVVGLFLMYLQNRESLCLEFNHQAIVAGFGCDQEGAPTKGSFLIRLMMLV